MRRITAISYGKPTIWGRCFSIVRKPGICAVGERVNVTLADEPGLTWSGQAECFGVTQCRNGRAVYDFEKVGDAKWLKRNRQ